MEDADFWAAVKQYAKAQHREEHDTIVDIACSTPGQYPEELVGAVLHRLSVQVVRNEQAGLTTLGEPRYDPRSVAL